MDWLDLLADQGTLKSLLQHHSSKASILRCSAFFIVQLSHPYKITGKTIALTRWTFEGKEFCNERGSWAWIYIIYISGNILFFTISFTNLKDIPSCPFQPEVHINSPLGYRKIFKSPISPILRAKRNKNRKLDCYFPYKIWTHILTAISHIYVQNPRSWNRKTEVLEFNPWEHKFLAFTKCYQRNWFLCFVFIMTAFSFYDDRCICFL